MCFFFFFFFFYRSVFLSSHEPACPPTPSFFMFTASFFRLPRVGVLFLSFLVLHFLKFSSSLSLLIPFLFPELPFCFLTHIFTVLPPVSLSGNIVFFSWPHNAGRFSPIRAFRVSFVFALPLSVIFFLLVLDQGHAN